VIVEGVAEHRKEIVEEELLPFFLSVSLLSLFFELDIFHFVLSFSMFQK
jgi:hypothetical protein